MSWRSEKLGDLITESRIPANNPDPNRRIRVKLNVLGVEKRPFENEVAGATKQFLRKAGQFIYGKQNLHKGAFGIIPDELDGFETSADIPSFDVREDCLPEWIFYYFKVGNRYLEMVKYARGVGSKRIHPEQIADINIPLPNIKEQRILVDRFKKIEENSQNISSEFENQETLLTQLRQSFLREAMQGKLVKQDHKDGHAKDLLEKIKTEKAKSGRKEKELPPIKPDEIPFKIPENWVWCRLGEVIRLISGQHIDSKDYNTVNEGLPYLTGPSDFGKIHPQPTRWTKKPKVTAALGDILITVKGSGVGKTNISNLSQVVIGRQLMAVRPLMINRDFILHYLSTSFEVLQEEKKGTGIPGISRENITERFFALPPLKEQQRILQKLNELMNLCDYLQQSIKDTREKNELLLQQVLKEAFME